MPTIAERRTALHDRFDPWVPVTLDGWLDRCAMDYPERPAGDHR